MSSMLANITADQYVIIALKALYCFKHPFVVETHSIDDGLVFFICR